MGGPSRWEFAPDMGNPEGIPLDQCVAMVVAHHAVWGPPGHAIMPTMSGDPTRDAKWALVLAWAKSLTPDDVPAMQIVYRRARAELLKLSEEQPR